MRKWVGAVSTVTLLLLALGTETWPQQNQGHALSFGVIIWRSPILTAQFWNPILRYVSEKSGVLLQLKVAQTGPEHTAMVRRGEYHFLYSNHNFIKENEESGYRVFGRSKDDVGTGEIVVLKDSPIKSLTELQGQEVVFPHTAAFYGYHLPMDALLRKGIQVKVAFAGNQEGAMGQLKAGRAVAAGVNAAVMQAFAQRENVAYRTLWSSDKYVTLALSAHPNVPADTVKAVREAFLKMSDDPEGAKVLLASAAVLEPPRPGKDPRPLRFVASKDSEFDNIRKFYRTTLVKVELQ
ncbi:MAG TPA: phosphate/phosphite/phosphonate ABC transporter substrate-binding protein [Methylomirabilota bacterium]|nr:phosphate/phosphite/phosphonate ABC transporter substrate-binding protein [Methylomirabilota bacterium]